MATIYEVAKLAGVSPATVSRVFNGNVVSPEKERLVISLYYVDELTMKEIGSILGVNESRVSQIHSKAVGRLRTSLDFLAA